MPPFGGGVYRGESPEQLAGEGEISADQLSSIEELSGVSYGIFARTFLRCFVAPN
jgi:hypothetical protein